MNYTFEILGVVPILQLFMFDHQHPLRLRDSFQGVEYIGTRRCTLDAFLDPIETMTRQQGWDLDRLIQTVVEFWVNHPDSIQLWKERLDRASDDTVLVARVGNLKALKQEFEWMLALGA